MAENTPTSPLPLRTLMQQDILTVGQFSSLELAHAPQLPYPLNKEMDLLVSTGLGSFMVNSSLSLSLSSSWKDDNSNLILVMKPCLCLLVPED